MHRSANGVPACFAAIGTRLCPVMPGDVLTSRNEYVPSARRIRSSRPQPLQPIHSTLNLTAGSAELRAAHPFSLNLKVRSPGQTHLYASGGLSHLGDLQFHEEREGQLPPAGGCRSTDGHYPIQIGEKPMTTVKYSVPNISCNHCTHTIQMEVSEMEGVKSVTADVTSKMVTVTFEPPATDESIKALMAEIDYPVAA